MKNNFKLNKTYSVCLLKKDSTYEYNYKIVVTGIFDNKITCVASEYVTRSPLQEIIFNDYSKIEVSEINTQDFSDEYIERVISEIRDTEANVFRLKAELHKRTQYIKNRSFLGKVITFLRK